MPNLKPYYDAALAADANVKRILAEMDAAFTDGTDEGKEKALSLRPALDEAQKKAEEANRLYASMRDASLTNDSASSLFTLPPDPAANDQKDDGPKVINRAAFDAMSVSDRQKYIGAGGRIVDELRTIR